MDPALWQDEDELLDDPKTREAAVLEALLWAGAELPTTKRPEPQPEPEPGPATANNAAATADIAERAVAMKIATQRHEEYAAQRAANRAAKRDEKIAEAKARQEKQLGYAARRDQVLVELAVEQAAASERLTQYETDASTAAALREREENDVAAEVVSSAAKFSAAAVEYEERKLVEHEALVARRAEELTEKQAIHAKTREEKMAEIENRYGL